MAGQRLARRAKKTSFSVRQPPSDSDAYLLERARKPNARTRARKKLFENQIEIPPPRVENERRIAQLLRAAQLCSDLYRFVTFYKVRRRNGQKVGDALNPWGAVSRTV